MPAPFPAPLVPKFLLFVPERPVAPNSRFFSPKLVSNVAIYVCAITVGSMSYCMADRKHRKAFLEARQSLEVKLNLEEQSQQQGNRDGWGWTKGLQKRRQESMMGLGPRPRQG